MTRGGLIPRRAVLLGALAIPFTGVARSTGIADAAGRHFGFSEVVRRAAALAVRPHRVDPSLPATVRAWGYDEYGAIQFEPSRTLWRGEGLRYEAQFFPRGGRFTDRVDVNVVEEGRVRALRYDRSLFRGWPATASDQTADLGFAGLRLHYPIAREDAHQECVVFLGASYFRAVGRDQRYGVSARAVAVDTALARDEEFPAFREYWLVRPNRGDDDITLFALLDGPSLAGAFQFRIRPGIETRLDITAEVFARRRVEKLGLAPLSSMFLYGKDGGRVFDDFRPEVHDSDGLLIRAGSGEWIWRPLANLTQLRVSRFRDHDPHGFGLLQRDRAYDHYQDLEAVYHRRPSAWIEPVGGWGSGTLELIEFPSRVEYHDNVAVLWVSDRRLDPGQSRRWAYRLRVGAETLEPSPQGRVVGTRTAAGPGADARRFVLEYEGGVLASLDETAGVDAVVSASVGLVTRPVVQPTPPGGWRVVFDLVGARQPTELRCFLRRGPDTLTETWSHQWIPGAPR